MYEDFVPERLSSLRISKDVSAREMSLSIGQNENYINTIENKKSLPSMQSFFYICEFLKISPMEFFDEGVENPERLKNLIADLKTLDYEQLNGVITIVKALKK